MVEITLVRHAQSAAQLQPHLIIGRYPLTPLTQAGHEQAHLLGMRFKRERARFDQVFASPAIRTCSTLDIVGGYIGFDHLDISLDDALHELDRGEWDGKERAELFRQEPSTRKRIKRQGVDFSLKNGESPRDVAVRMLGWARQQVDRAAGNSRRILACSHCMAINCLVWALFDRDETFALNPDIENTSITRIQFSADTWKLASLNDHAHLLS